MFLTGFFLICVSQINAQQNNQSSENDKNADVAITANVAARELKFEIVPNPKVEFAGTKERVTIWEADRKNLPKPVETGVTYRNIGIQLRITSRFADIERIVAEALGEIPISDKPETVNMPTNQVPQNPSNQKTPR